MTGELCRASAFAEWGVVNALFEPDEFHEAVHACAMRLATGPSMAHAATKRIVRAYLDGGVSAADAALLHRPGVYHPSTGACLSGGSARRSFPA